MKAVYQEVNRRPIFTHDLARICREPGARGDIIDAAMELTPDYTVTRYPNAVGGIPADLYGKNIAARRLKLSLGIIQWVKRRLQDQSNT